MTYWANDDDFELGAGVAPDSTKWNLTAGTPNVVKHNGSGSLYIDPSNTAAGEWIFEAQNVLDGIVSGGTGDYVFSIISDVFGSNYVGAGAASVQRTCFGITERLKSDDSLSKRWLIGHGSKGAIDPETVTGDTWIGATHDPVIEELYTDIGIPLRVKITADDLGELKIHYWYNDQWNTHSGVGIVYCNTSLYDYYVTLYYVTAANAVPDVGQENAISQVNKLYTQQEDDFSLLDYAIIDPLKWVQLRTQEGCIAHHKSKRLELRKEGTTNSGLLLLRSFAQITGPFTYYYKVSAGEPYATTSDLVMALVGLVQMSGASINKSILGGVTWKSPAYDLQVFNITASGNPTRIVSLQPAYTVTNDTHLMRVRWDGVNGSYLRFAIFDIDSDDWIENESTSSTLAVNTSYDLYLSIGYRGHDFSAVTELPFADDIYAKWDGVDVALESEGNIESEYPEPLSYNIEGDGEIVSSQLANYLVETIIDNEGDILSDITVVSNTNTTALFSEGTILSSIITEQIVPTNIDTETDPNSVVVDGTIMVSLIEGQAEIISESFSDIQVNVPLETEGCMISEIHQDIVISIPIEGCTEITKDALLTGLCIVNIDAEFDLQSASTKSNIVSAVVESVTDIVSGVFSEYIIPNVTESIGDIISEAAKSYDVASILEGEGEPSSNSLITYFLDNIIAGETEILSDKTHAFVCNITVQAEGDFTSAVLTESIVVSITEGITEIPIGSEFIDFDDIAIGRMLALYGKTLQPSIFSNYEFDSFIEYEGSYIGIKADGLYLLDGEKDDTAVIKPIVEIDLDKMGTNLRKHIGAIHSSSGDECDINLDGEIESYKANKGGAFYCKSEHFGKKFILTIRNFQELNDVELFYYKISRLV